jgi:hypothetical protein
MKIIQFYFIFGLFIMFSLIYFTSITPEIIIKNKYYINKCTGKLNYFGD